MATWVFKKGHSKKSEKRSYQRSYQQHQATPLAVKYVLPRNKMKADLGVCHLR